MRRINKNWLHWQCCGGRFGFMSNPGYWKFEFERIEYTKAICYRFWRFFIFIEK